MDADKRTRLNEIQSTLGTAGWQYLLEDMQRQYDDLVRGAIRNCNDEKSLYYAKGYHDALYLFLNTEKIVEVQLNPPYEADFDAAPV